MIHEGSKIADWTVEKETEPYISPNNGVKFRRYFCRRLIRSKDAYIIWERL